MTGSGRVIPPLQGPAEKNPMPTRLWLILAVAVLAGIAVLYAKPSGRKPRSSVPWRGQVKPPPPPP